MADQTFAVHCGFFDAINSDRTYSADEMNRPYKRVISNGVFATPNGTPSTDLQVTASSGMNIICKKGEGLFGDKWFENPSGIAITVPSNTGTVPRIDSVLVQVDTRTSGRVGNIVHRTGTPASSPIPPAINQVEGVVEYRLANIRVNAGVSAITQSMITDRRGSSDCPWVTSLIYQVDTSTLYDQWQAAYAEYFEQEKAIWDAWYSQLTEDLDVSMTLDRHTNTVTTTAQTTGTIPIGLAYNHNTDILEVYINGLRAIEGTHYVVVDGDTSIQVENQLQIGQEVTFVVMRSVISGSATNITVLLQELESQIAGIAGGTPTVVDAKADMTEHDKIYILSTDSKWYYYSATAEDWVIGGTYGGVPTDTTLTQEGMAADAKAVGDALSGVSDDIDAIDGRVTDVESVAENAKGLTTIPIEGTWVQGEIKSSGANGSSDKRIRLNTFDLYVSAGAYIVCDNPEYQFGVAEYSGQTAGTFIVMDSWANETEIQNDSYIRIVMRYADNRLVSADDLVNMPASLTMYTSNDSVAYRLDTIDKEIDSLEEIKDQFSTPFSALWEIGSIRETGSNASATNRIRTTNYNGSLNGYTIKTTNPLYKISTHIYSSESSASQITHFEWAQENKIEDDGYVRIVMAYTDDRDVTSDDLTTLPASLIVYKSDSMTAEIEYMKDEIDSGESNIADYYEEEMADTIDKVGKLQSEPALTFLTVTDIHRYVAGVQNFSNTIRNMKYFAEKVFCDFILNLGDNIEGNTPRDTTFGYERDMLKDFHSIGVPYVFTLGNHDTNPYYVLDNVRYPFDMGQCYAACYAQTRASRINISENGTDYYIDFDDVDVRLISINGNNVNAGRNTYAFGATSAAFLTDVLDTDKKIIFTTHESSYRDHVFDRQEVSNNAGITSAIEAFIAGGGSIFELSGHSHVDMAFISPWTAIMQVCQKFEQADLTLSGYQVITGYIDGIGNPARAAQTATEDAWSVNIYKPISNTLHQIRFGAGYDRHFHLTHVAPATLTSILDDVTWSSSNTSVATVSNGVVTGVAAGTCAILAKDSTGNYECWIVDVA